MEIIEGSSATLLFEGGMPLTKHEIEAALQPLDHWKAWADYHNRVKNSSSSRPNAFFEEHENAGPFDWS